MIQLFYLNVDNLNLSQGYNLVSDYRKRKIDFYRFLKDKKLSCGSELLLLHVLKKLGIENPIFKEDNHKKPFIENYLDIHFNLSHSQNMVACGVSDMPIGVDIEYVDPKIDLDIAKHYFFNNEYLSIMNAKKPYEEFFNYWVLKESYMKYTALGFKLPLDSFFINLKTSQNIELKIANKLIDDVKFSLFSVGSFKLATASKYKINKAIELEISDILDY